jgi:hypothetical protein
MRARLLALVSAISLVLTAVVVTAPAAEAAGFPGWTRTRLSVASMNQTLSGLGLNFFAIKDSAGPQGRKPPPPRGNTFSNFLNQQTQNLVFRVRKGFNGALPAMTLVLKDSNGKKQRFTFNQVNTNGIISLSFVYNGQTISFSPT